MFFLHGKYKQYIDSFEPKYKQGQTVFVTLDGKKKKMKISGAQLNRNGSFVSWRGFVSGQIAFKKDPKCPWDLMGKVGVFTRSGLKQFSFIKDNV